MKKFDYILICIFLIIGAIFFTIYNCASKQGRYVCISSANNECKYIPINEDTTLKISSPGNGFNIICIKNGYVNVTEATCPDLICTKHSPISKTGETIVCLPNKLAITITDDIPPN